MAHQSHAYKYDSLKFCTECSFAYTICVVNGELKMVCQKCGFEEGTDNIIVHRNDYERKDLDRDYLINKNSRFDRTLPVTYHEPCPKCASKGCKFQKYNDSKMALMFFCLSENCGFVWKR